MGTSPARTTARVAAWAWGANGCTTGCSAGHGAPTRPAEASAPAKRRAGAARGAGPGAHPTPWRLPFFIVTHRPEEQPDGGEFTFTGSLAEAIERARAAAGDKQVHVMGGADIIRQALAAGYVDELTVIIAPVVLGAGKRLFDGFTQSLDLEHRGVRQSRYATFIDYRV